jgi:hypothetical protein
LRERREEWSLFALEPGPEAIAALAIRARSIRIKQHQFEPGSSGTRWRVRASKNMSINNNEDFL